MKKKTKKVLVIAAHPDDEVLGCGATLYKLSKKKYKIKVIFLSDGESSRKINNKKIIKDLIKKRENQAIKSAKILGIKKLKFFRLPDNKLDSFDLLKINQIIENEIKLFKPNIIFTHSNHDLNVDHVVAHNATITACRAYKFRFINSIYAFEISSNTESNFKISKKKFSPNVFIDIKNEITKKLEALSQYKNELEKWPHPRSLKALKILAHYRGTQSGLDSAEAFQLIRENKKLI